MKKYAFFYLHNLIALETFMNRYLVIPFQQTINNEGNYANVVLALERSRRTVSRTEFYLLQPHGILFAECGTGPQCALYHPTAEPILPTPYPRPGQPNQPNQPGQARPARSQQIKFYNNIGNIFK